MIVTPSHLLEQWHSETRKFAPDGVRLIRGIAGYSQWVADSTLPHGEPVTMHTGLPARLVVIEDTGGPLCPPSYSIGILLYWRTTLSSFVLSIGILLR